MNFFFFLWISVTEVQPLFASTSKASNQEDLSSRNYQLKALFKLSGIENSLENIESVVDMSANINKKVLRPGQVELSRRIMTKAFSSKKFYHRLKSPFIENHKPQYLRLAVQWYQSALGKKILRLEREMSDPLNRLAIGAFGKKLLNSPPSKMRIRLVERIESSTHVTEAAKTLFLEYVRLMHPFNKKVDTKEHFKNLKVLKISGISMGDKGFQLIINSNSLKQLEELEVAGNSISKNGLKMLANSSILPNLKKLDLRRNRLEDEDQIFLARSPKFGNLKLIRF